jgi:hypothetical protein
MADDASLPPTPVGGKVKKQKNGFYNIITHDQKNIFLLAVLLE